MRILLVEDHEVLRRALARSLRIRGHVDEVDCLRAAMDHLRDDAPYDVIITDDRLPDGSGRVLLEQARQVRSACRRVLMSSEDALCEHESSPPYDRFFRKPHELVTLIYWIDHLRRRFALESRGES